MVLCSVMLCSGLQWCHVREQNTAFRVLKSWQGITDRTIDECVAEFIVFIVMSPFLSFYT